MHKNLHQQKLIIMVSTRFEPLADNIFFKSDEQLLTSLLPTFHHHHYQPINVPTAGAQALLMDYT
jgi:hypothetical protein